MGFETREEAERWAENIEFRAKAKKEEALLSDGAQIAWETFIADNPEFGTVQHRYLVEIAHTAFLRGYRTAKAGG